jgi:hypothetical protein
MEKSLSVWTSSWGAGHLALGNPYGVQMFRSREICFLASFKAQQQTLSTQKLLIKSRPMEIKRRSF